MERTRVLKKLDAVPNYVVRFIPVGAKEVRNSARDHAAPARADGPADPPAARATDRTRAPADGRAVRPDGHGGTAHGGPHHPLPRPGGEGG